MYLGTQFLFDAVQVEPVFVCDEIDSQPQMAEAPRAANSMKVRLCVLWEIKVDDDINGLDIDTASEKIGRD